MYSCAPPFCGSYVEDVSALSIVHTETSPGMGGQENVLLEATNFMERGHMVLLTGQSDGESRGEASQTGAPVELVQLIPRLILQENLR